MTLRKTLIFLSAISVFFIFSGHGYCGTPYSANGIGSLLNDNAGRAMGMGGVGVANDDGESILRDNPALIAGAKKNILALSVVYSKTKTMMGNDGDFTYSKSLPSAFKIVLPIYKGIVLGWGLYPYSRTDINMLFKGSQDGIQTRDEVSSTGGVNVSSASVAGSFRNYVRVGFAFNYNFGMISENWERTFPSDSLLTSSYYQLKRKFGGYSKSVGVVANVTKWMALGAGYTTKSEMDQRITVHTGTISDPEKILTTVTTVLPETWRTGVMLKFGEKFSAGSDIAYAGWEKAARTAKEKQLYNNTIKIGTGIRYNPTPRFSDAYYKKIPVSIGFSYGSLYYKSYPVIDTITEKSVTLGVEFPLRNNAGSILTSLEYGKRGDKSKNGWDENFMCFGISFIGRMQ